MKEVFIILSLIFVSCNAQKNAITEEESTLANLKLKNGFELVLQEQNSSFEVAEIVIIKNAKRLKSFYSKVNMTRKPGLPVPTIDFTKEMIVIQCAGKQEYNGFLVLSVLQESDNQVILKSKIEIDNDDNSASRVYSPFCIYKMNLTQKEIIFKKEK